MTRVVLFSIALATTALTPAIAHANGDTAHAWITDQAVDRLPDGTLKRLLARPELYQALINGSAFPDGGYIFNDDYGEMAHWEPFLQAYIEWIRASFPQPLTSEEAAPHVAFLMGIASHGLADQTFDSAFGPSARIHDAATWSDGLLEDHDSNTDLILVEQTGARYDDVQPWVPANELSALYQDRFDYAISGDALRQAQDLLHSLTLSYAAIADEDTRAAAVARYPWSAANLLDPTEPGAPPNQAEVVADYWLAVWDRLHGVQAAENFVIATYPRSGAAGHPIDRDLIESQVMIVLGHGVETARFAGHVSVVDDAGHTYEIEVTSVWNTAVTNTLRIRPQEDWADGHDFTVTVSPGVEAIDGLALTTPFQFTFSTRQAAPSAPTSDPTPHPGEATSGGGGCAVAGGGGPLIALASVLIALRRRRRGRS